MSCLFILGILWRKKGGGDALPATPKYYRKKCKFSTSITEVEIIFVIYIFILSQSFNMSSSLDSKESINNSRHNFLPHRLSSLSHFTSLATLLKYPIQMHNAWNIEAKHNSEWFSFSDFGNQCWKCNITIFIIGWRKGMKIKPTGPEYWVYDWVEWIFYHQKLHWHVWKCIMACG